MNANCFFFRTGENTILRSLNLFLPQTLSKNGQDSLS